MTTILTRFGVGAKVDRGAREHLNFATEPGAGIGVTAPHNATLEYRGDRLDIPGTPLGERFAQRTDFAHQRSKNERPGRKLVTLC